MLTVLVRVMGETKMTGFQVVEGKVTVDAESFKNAKTPEQKAAAQRTIKYNVYEIEAEPPLSFEELANELLSKGFSQDVEFEKDKDNNVKKNTKGFPVTTGKSLVELLAQGYRNFEYTNAVAKAKSDYNNSPDKVLSSAETMLLGLINSDTATEAQKAQARKMLEAYRAVAA